MSCLKHDQEVYTEKKRRRGHPRDCVKFKEKTPNRTDRIEETLRRLEENQEAIMYALRVIVLKTLQTIERQKVLNRMQGRPRK